MEDMQLGLQERLQGGAHGHLQGAALWSHQRRSFRLVRGQRSASRRRPSQQLMTKSPMPA
eukprot:6999422-Pyramimonas_sp.AAC.1